MAKRPANKPKYTPKDKMLAPTLTHMREVAFGNKAYFETKAVLEHAERMRDDDALLAAAEEKRKRKLEKQMKTLKAIGWASK